MVNNKNKFSLFTLTVFSTLFFQQTLAANYNYAEALQDSIYFFDAQRLGHLPDTNRVPWRGDAFLKDQQAIIAGTNQTVDLMGGYADAGDNVKYNLPQVFTAATLSWSLLAFKDAYSYSDDKLNQYQYALNNLRWACDYILKSWDPTNKRFYAQVGTTEIDHNQFYMPYELIDYLSTARTAYYIDETHPGPDLAASAAAALAASSIVFKQSGDTNYATQLLNAANGLYNLSKDTLNSGKTYDQTIATEGDPGTTSTYHTNSLDNVKAHFAFASVWLALATQDKQYLSNDAVPMPTPSKGRPWTYCWDDQSYGVYTLLATADNLFGSTFIKDNAPDLEVAANNFVDSYLQNWIENSGPNVVPKTPAGLSILDNWGNLRYVSSTAMMSLLYAKYGLKPSHDSSYYSDYAVSQMNYILGNNPQKMSYIVGFTNSGTNQNWPHYIHHATAEGGWSGINDAGNFQYPDRHIDYGALVGGPDATDGYNDTYQIRSNYTYSEVAIDYNSVLQGALAGLNDLYRGTPISSDQFPKPVPASEQHNFYAGAAYQIQEQNDSSVANVQLEIYNHSGWTPKPLYQAKAYFYLQLNDPKGVAITASGMDGASINPELVSIGQNYYYFTIPVTRSPFMPGASNGNNSYARVNIQITVPGKHDFSQDWSLQNAQQGQPPSQHDFKETPNIVIYGATTDSGPVEKVAGVEPTTTTGTITVGFNSVPENLPQGTTANISVDGIATGTTCLVSTAGCLLNNIAVGTHTVSVSDIKVKVSDKQSDIYQFNPINQVNVTQGNNTPVNFTFNQKQTLWHLPLSYLLQFNNELSSQSYIVNFTGNKGSTSTCTVQTDSKNTCQVDGFEGETLTIQSPVIPGFTLDAKSTASVAVNDGTLSPNQAVAVYDAIPTAAAQTQVSGLPSQMTAGITFTASSGKSKTETLSNGTDTFTDFPADSYTATVNNVQKDGVTYVPSPSQFQFEVKSTDKLVQLPAIQFKEQTGGQCTTNLKLDNSWEQGGQTVYQYTLMIDDPSISQQADGSNLDINVNFADASSVLGGWSLFGGTTTYNGTHIEINGPYWHNSQLGLGVQVMADTSAIPSVPTVSVNGTSCN